MLESIPPDRKAPTGTSLIMCSEQERSSSSHSTDSSGSTALLRKDQYREVRAEPSASTISRQPGRSLWMPANRVSGAGVNS